MILCPLCRQGSPHHYHSDKRRDYLQCARCQLVFVTPEQLPDAREEKAIYDLHQNSADDPGYLAFLQRLANPLLERLPACSRGLDYGCGPNPVLAQLLSRQGHLMQYHDPFYHPLADVHGRQFDFISCTEAIEHFHRPATAWHHWMNMLLPGGYLAIMTKRVIDAERFSRWHYKNDLTHVSFFSDATFDWLARHHALELEVVGADVVFFHRPAV